MSGLLARLGLERESFVLDAELDLPSRGVTAVFGPSGSGKSTLLRCLAGLEADARGTVSLHGKDWQDSSRGLFVPPHRRSVGYVFQEAELFQHLDVRGNLRYAARRAPEALVSWDEAVEWLGLGGLLDRKPAGLSGGERQRVAIARALLSGPRLLLMDEPVSALDETSRREILGYLERLVSRLSIPTIYVSHSLREVLRLADHMIWLVDGRVRASGTPAEVVREGGFARWQGEEAAVVVEATVREDPSSDASRYGLTVLDGPWGPIWTRLPAHAAGAVVRIQIRASDVSLGLDRDERTSILNQFPLQVLTLDAGEEGEVLVTLGLPDEPAILLARITALSRDRLGLTPGTQVFARVKSVAVIE